MELHYSVQGSVGMPPDDFRDYQYFPGSHMAAATSYQASEALQGPWDDIFNRAQHCVPNNASRSAAPYRTMEGATAPFAHAYGQYADQPCVGPMSLWNDIPPDFANLGAHRRDPPYEIGSALLRSHEALLGYIQQANARKEYPLETWSAAGHSFANEWTKHMQEQQWHQHIAAPAAPDTSTAPGTSTPPPVSGSREDPEESDDAPTPNEEETDPGKVVKNIEAAVANFLNGYDDNEMDDDDDEDGEAVPLAPPPNPPHAFPPAPPPPCHSRAAKQLGTFPALSQHPPVSQSPPPGLYGVSPSIQISSTSNRGRGACLSRGDDLSKKLVKMPMPSSIPSASKVDLQHEVKVAILGLYRRGIRPCVGRIQQTLRERASETTLRQEIVDELIDSVVPFCVKLPSCFALWVDVDAELCIIVRDLDEEGQMQLLEDRSQHDDYVTPDYSGPFLEAFIEKLACLSRREERRRRGLVAPAPIRVDAQFPLGSEAAISTPVLPGRVGAGYITPPSMPATRSMAPTAMGSDSYFGVNQNLSASTTNTPKPSSISTPPLTTNGDAQLVISIAKVQTGDENLTTSAVALGESLQAQGVTTLMIRNMPHHITQKRLIEELNNTGYQGLFDFCYMPSTFGNGAGKGYAFVNLVSSDIVASFVADWHGSRPFGMNLSDMAVNITAAVLQGREQNAKKWDGPRMRRVRNPALRPLVIGGRTDERADLGEESALQTAEGHCVPGDYKDDDDETDERDEV